MHWFRRPPYLRWSVAALIVAVGALGELEQRQAVDHPFAATALTAGEAIDAADVEWRPLPPGRLPPVAPVGETVARSVAAGEPLRPSDLAPAPAVPAGWWSVPLRLPVGARPGLAVRLVGDDPPVVAEGVVVTASSEPDLLSGGEDGLVAVPAAAAADVATAAGRGTLVVLLGN